MTTYERLPARSVPARSLYRPLRAFAASCLIGALATDIAYVLTTDVIWVDFSDWLVPIGAAVGVVALIVGLIELVARRGLARPRLPSLVFDLFAWAVAILNVLVHSRDGWTSVAPWGLTLSAIAVLLIFVSEWASRAAPAPQVSERAA